MKSLQDRLRAMNSDPLQGSMPTFSSAEDHAHDETYLPNSMDGAGLDLESPCRLCGGEAVCGGLGVLRYNVPIGDPRFGKLFRCPHYLIENDHERQQKLRKLSNLGAFTEKSFENFIVDSPMFTPPQQASLRMAFDIAVKFAQDPSNLWLLLEGTYGCGKTHLAAAIANERLRHGDEVLFITSPDLLDHLRGTYAPNSEMSYDETFERVRNTKLLILDDLGVENPSAWAQEKLFQLLNHRYTHQLPTIITTNSAVDKLDPRIRSRLLDNTHTHRVMITAPDYRTQRQDERMQLSSALPLYAEMTFQTFDTFNFTTPDERTNLEKAVQAAWMYAQKPDSRWLLLAGSYGTGKTHLAAAIANYRRTFSSSADELMFITVPELIDYLKSTFAVDSNVSFDQRFQQIKNVPFLVLDDLGTETASTWAKEKLFQIIDYRYVTRKPTVFTTSREIEKLDERIRTRIFDRRLCIRFELLVRSYVMRQR